MLGAGQVVSSCQVRLAGRDHPGTAEHDVHAAQQNRLATHPEEL